MPKAFFLCGIKFIASRSEVLVEFSNGFRKKTRRFEFFPSFLVSLKGMEREAFASLLALFSPDTLVVEKPDQKNARVSALSFTELKKFHSFLVSSLKLQTLFLEPERQFLLERGWSYFDAFKFIKQEPVRLSETIPPKTTSIPLKKTIASSLLRVAPSKITLNDFFVAERFLENLFFRNNFCPRKGSVEKTPFFDTPPKIFVESLNEVSLSGIWPVLFTFPFYNLGFDSLNCRCCKPRSFFDSNLSPASMVKVRFLVDGFYFESAFPEWAESFHSLNKSRRQRQRKRKEWFLNSHPVGPFFRGSTAAVPLTDALELIGSKSAEFRGFSNVLWFCRKNEGFLSRELSALNRRVTELNSLLQEIEGKALNRSGLGFSSRLRENKMYHFLSCSRDFLQRTFELVPFHLSCSDSGFYSPALSDSIKCIQHSVLKKFREFLNENGARHLFSSPSRSFFQTDSALLLVKEFSRKQRLPVPRIVS